MLFSRRLRLLIFLPCILLFPIQSAGAQSEQEQEETTEINVKNADIAAVVRIFSKKTKRNFILDERVKGKVSIYLPGKVTAKESLQILDAVLALKGFTSVPISENLWKIVPAKEAIQSTVPTITGDDPDREAGAAVVTRLFHLKHISADEAQQLLTPLISGSGLINAYTGTNSLIIIDSEDNIERIVDLLDSLDVAASQREMTIIPVEHAVAADIADKINQILSEEDGAIDASGDGGAASRIEAIRARIQNRAAAARTGQDGDGGAVVNASGETVSARSTAPKIIADERTNSIIVVGDEETTARVRALVDALDSEIDRSGFRFYVYRCKNASAEELAEVLANLAGGETGGGSGSGINESNPLGLNRNSRNRGGQFASTQDRLGQQSRTPGRSRSEDAAGSDTSVSVQFGENVSVTADPATNSLIIFSGKTEYEKLLELLSQLDVRPRQVLVEAMLLEVRLSEDASKGFEFLTSAGGADGGILAQSSFGGNLAQLISDPTALSDFTVAAASSGSLTLPGDITIPTQTVLLNAARNNNRVNVLSSPNILATDNQQAEIVVGQNVPFIASTSTSGDNLNNTFNTIDRQDVGITLRLTPQISSNDTVRLAIFTEVSSVLASSANSELGPTTTIRTSETTTITKNNQMVVIGGLMSDNVTEVDSGVPYLMDVPVLGHVFKSRIETVERTNLLIFITPRIIRDQFDAREVSLDHRDEMDYTINRNELVPPRNELLHNPDLDSVIEADPYDGDSPTTILPAEREQRASLSRSSSVIDTPAMEQESREEQEVLEYTIEPRFQPESKPASVSKRDVGAKYVILRITEDAPQSLSLPFQHATTDALVRLFIPGSSASKALPFFSAGSRYRYGSAEESATLQVEGVFSDPQEVTALYPDAVGSWYSLSPFEIMNLGKGPWYQAAS